VKWNCASIKGSQRVPAHSSPPPLASAPPTRSHSSHGSPRAVAGSSRRPPPRPRAAAAMTAVARRPSPTAAPHVDTGKYVRYTPEQVEALERVYSECPKPSSLRRQQLVRDCPILRNIEPKQIKVWFQNRRYVQPHSPNRPMRGRRPLSPPEVVRFCAFSFAAAGVGMSLDAACFPFFVRALPCAERGELCASLVWADLVRSGSVSAVSLLGLS
jgi:hypothetical protein